jgi:putative transposase
LGNFDRHLGSARYAGRDRRFRPALVGKNRDRRRAVIGWLNITASKFYDWRERYGKVNEHNGWVPRDFWLEDWEKQAIIGFHLKNPLEGYRRLTFMMRDADIVAVSPSSVWRVLGQAGLLPKWKGQPSKKGTGFD